jgi:hypothetical protein
MCPRYTVRYPVRYTVRSTAPCTERHRERFNNAASFRCSIHRSNVNGAGGLHDFREAAGVEAGAADEGAVDVGLAH